jgi:3-dehydroquinate synthase
MAGLTIRLPKQEHAYEIFIVNGRLSGAGYVAREALGKETRRVAVFSNEKVFTLYGSELVRGLKHNDFAVDHWLMGDGERNKSLKSFEKALVFLSERGFERTDAVISLGGGVVGDLAGFVAATYLRGLPVIHVPTTLLAQVDSSVGGKTGINLPAGKNLVGSFHQPAAVLIDIMTLTTLPPREFVAGWCECVKQGAVAGNALLRQTMRYLIAAHRENSMVLPELAELIEQHCEFKASVVMADEREVAGQTDKLSRKILNFGHTIAHALEVVTDYKRFRHGEAVGHGMLVAGELSKNLGLLADSELELLERAVRLCGPLPSARNLNASDIIDAIAQDKKRKHGRVQWVLLEGIGRPRVVDGAKIGGKLLRKTIQTVFKQEKV